MKLLLMVVILLLACLVPSLADTTCQCDNVGVAGAGNNGYTCTDDSSSAFCSTQQVCCSFETVDVSNKADLCCQNCTDTATCSCANPNECSPMNGFVCTDSNVTTTLCSPPEPFCDVEQACVSESSFGPHETSEQCQLKDECKTPAPTLEPTPAPTPEPTPSPTSKPTIDYSGCNLSGTSLMLPCRKMAILEFISPERRARNLHQNGPHGTADLVFDSPTKFRLTVSVEDVEEDCSNCNLYISESPDCSQDVIPTHPTVYNNDTSMGDPWEDITYSVSNKKIDYEQEFDHGVDFSQYEGKTMVLEDETGRPAICGIFMSFANDTSPTEAPTTSGATPLWKSGLFVAMGAAAFLMG